MKAFRTYPWLNGAKDGRAGIDGHGMARGSRDRPAVVPGPTSSSLKENKTNVFVFTVGDVGNNLYGVLGEDSPVVNSGQGEVGGRVPDQLLVCAIQCFDRDRDGDGHHGFFAMEQEQAAEELRGDLAVRAVHQLPARANHVHPVVQTRFQQIHQRRGIRLYATRLPRMDSRHQPQLPDG